MSQILSRIWYRKFSKANLELKSSSTLPQVELSALTLETGKKQIWPPCPEIHRQHFNFVIIAVRRIGDYCNHW